MKRITALSQCAPGNPGLIDFYTQFLSSLHDMFRDDQLAILAHAHLGHTSHLNVSMKLGLLHQVEAALEAFDAIKTCWPGARVVLVGHSVGSWIATQVFIFALFLTMVFLTFIGPQNETKCCRCAVFAVPNIIKYGTDT